MSDENPTPPDPDAPAEALARARALARAKGLRPGSMPKRAPRGGAPERGTPTVTRRCSATSSTGW